MQNESLVKSRKYDCLDRVYDSVPFSNLSLLGTNESLSYASIIRNGKRHQSLELIEQIYQGFRVFEFTLAVINGKIHVVYLDKILCRFDEVIKLMSQYFILHPREAFFLFLHKSKHFKWREQDSYVLDKLYSEYKTCILYDERKELGYLRGKIWTLDFFGINYASRSFVDDGKVTAHSSGIDAKVINCFNQMKDYRNLDYIRVCNFHGSGVLAYWPFDNYRRFAMKLADSEIYNLNVDNPAIYMFDFPELFNTNGYDFNARLLERNYKLTY